LHRDEKIQCTHKIFQNTAFTGFEAIRNDIETKRDAKVKITRFLHCKYLLTSMHLPYFLYCTSASILFKIALPTFHAAVILTAKGSANCVKRLRWKDEEATESNQLNQNGPNSSILRNWRSKN
jgi:hypothetical protein